MPEVEDQRAEGEVREAVSAASIHAALMAAIRDGGYRPGGQLPTERQLSEQFGASRQQVRDAMLLLSQAGLVTRKVGSGTWLADEAARIIERLDGGSSSSGFGEVSALEAIEARLLMEPGVGALAARNINATQLQALKDALKSVREATTWADFRARADHFARCLYVAAGNRVLLRTFDAIVNSRDVATADGERQQRAVGEIVLRHAHGQLDQIFRAVADGDETRAETTTRANLVSLAASYGIS